MLAEVRLKAIRKLHQDTQFGYATVTCAIYHRDVGELLKEREQLLEEIMDLKEVAKRFVPPGDEDA